MAKAEIFSGIRGYTTIVDAAMGGRRRVLLTIESECKAVWQPRDTLTQVDPFQEIAFRGDGALTMGVARECLHHTVSPVPAGIIEGMEVAPSLHPMTTRR